MFSGGKVADSSGRKKESISLTICYEHARNIYL